MSRRYPLALSAAAVVAAGAVLVPGSSAQSDAETFTLELRHREAKVTFVDVAPKMTRRRPSESPGDMAVGSGRIRDASGRVVGRSHQAFMITGGRGEATREQVTATFVLADGQITLQGVADNSKPDQPVALAVTGGTGRYDGARGSAHAVSENQTAVTFELRLAR